VHLLSPSLALALHRIRIIPPRPAAPVSTHTLADRPPARIPRVAYDHHRVLFAARLVAPEVLGARAIRVKDLCWDIALNCRRGTSLDLRSPLNSPRSRDYTLLAIPAACAFVAAKPVVGAPMSRFDVAEVPLACQDAAASVCAHVCLFALVVDRVSRSDVVDISSRLDVGDFSSRRIRNTPRSLDLTFLPTFAGRLGVTLLALLTACARVAT
jgi:hypothetical protein